MKIHFCRRCGFAYDERHGMPAAGIRPGARWPDVPDDWRCPGCAAPKSEFRFSTTLIGEAPAPAQHTPASAPCSMRELVAELDGTDR